MFAFSKANNTITCNGSVTNSTVSNSSITTSSINMNGNVITNHSTPISPTDVVNKFYVDNLIKEFLITLTSTGYTVISNDILSGMITVNVRNIVEKGPCASFNVSKPSNTRQMSYIRTNSSSGETSGEKLVLRWLPGQPIELKKTGLSYDGVYRVRVILN
jgi:hypothetical protein